jgi:agmatinase
MNLNDFNPNGTGVDNGNYFGLPFAPDDSELVLLSVPWDVTSSYGDGAAQAPEAIIGASTQLDLYDPVNAGAWRRGIGTLPVDRSIGELSARLRDDARRVMSYLEKGGSIDSKSVRGRIERVNEASGQVNRMVYDAAGEWLDRGKTVGLVGGDHSTPYGLIRALGERLGEFSVLHIDAHADLRDAYEGFDHSHASIMFNVLRDVAQVTRLVQVGVRDQCDCEADMAASDQRITQFDDWSLATAEFRGLSWHEQCEAIVGHLGGNVYVSFDIDGLSPQNAPHTGTPVAGGLSFNRAVYLLDCVARSGRTIAGFDLCEVSPRAGDEWDANVGARMLYKLCNLTLKTK